MLMIQSIIYNVNPMSTKEADLLRQRIAELEREMMDFRTSMARLLSGLYETVHRLETSQSEQTRYENLKKLRDCIIEHFDMGEFKTMCFELGVSYDQLDGDGLSDKAREFVLYMNRLGRCPDVIKYCNETRPNNDFVL